MTRTRFARLLSACSLLVGLSACGPEALGPDETFRGVELEDLEPGQCAPLHEGIEAVTAEKWRVAKGLPEGIVIDDHLLLTSVFEDNVMLRVSGPATSEGEVLMVETATAIYNHPLLDDPCDGFCDGICIDGECYMNIPPYSVTVEGICY
ncbi:hypothetical protein PPSIR1_30706 [Plesiocystis pacifica SIR-1]|uniref:Lipoprotein n=1 Tax=Plesiocystis pacifica SIR-1 TaxID=391625 RepID=A6GAF4_9BACT|nr:hypothetical protein [Plesiocystis pacifica]EDM77142.1 hypothetical protein PPSIR1_30706 [Plesiocystis pacifica SIR-1]